MTPILFDFVKNVNEIISNVYSEYSLNQVLYLFHIIYKAIILFPV